MKKILCIMQLPPPIHGASLMNSYLEKSTLVNSNFIVELINLQFSSSQKNIEKFSFLKIFKAIYYAAAILNKAMRFKPDLVYFTLSSSGYGFYRDTFYVLILKLSNLKILFHLHGKGIKTESEKNFLNRTLYKFVFKNTEVICLTHNLTEDIKSVCSSIPYIVPCGIPIYSNSNQKINKNEKVAQILYLSNYIENKGILKLIDSLGLLKDQGVIFNARLVGSPTDLKIEAIENYIKKRKLENCVFAVGPKYGEDKYHEFLTSDIFAFPTFYSKEAFPLVNLEAMQFALPVVSTNEGGIPEAVINNVTGFVVEPRNVQQLAEKLRILIQNKHLREEMGLKGKEHFSKNFTLQHYEQNIKNVFDTILKTEDCHKLSKDLKAVSI